MSAAVEQSGLKAEGAPSPHPNLRDLLLLRIAVGGATRADLQRDVAPLLAARISGLEFRRSTELALSTMAGAQLTTESKGRLTVTEPRATGSRMAVVRNCPAHETGPGRHPGEAPRRSG